MASLPQFEGAGQRRGLAEEWNAMNAFVWKWGISPQITIPKMAIICNLFHAFACMVMRFLDCWGSAIVGPCLCPCRTSLQATAPLPGFSSSFPWQASCSVGGLTRPWEITRLLFGRCKRLAWSKGKIHRATDLGHMFSICCCEMSNSRTSLPSFHQRPALFVGATKIWPASPSPFEKAAAQSEITKNTHLTTQHFSDRVATGRGQRCWKLGARGWCAAVGTSGM